MTIAKIIGAHGVQGVCRVFSYADSPAVFSSGCRFYFRHSDRDMVPLEILDVRTRPRQLLLKIAGVGDRKAAQALAGTELWIKKSDLPPPEKGTYYWFDLIGMTVFTDRGETLGTLENILPTGSNDVYVVRDAAGRETLVPALETVIRRVDLEKKQMIVDLPEGL